MRGEYGQRTNVLHQRHLVLSRKVPTCRLAVQTSSTALSLTCSHVL